MLLLAAEQAMNTNITHINGWSVWWFAGYFTLWSFLVLSALKAIVVALADPTAPPVHERRLPLLMGTASTPWLAIAAGVAATAALLAGFFFGWVALLLLALVATALAATHLWSTSPLNTSPDDPVDFE